MFSDTVQLADINDFITLEQECIIQTGSNVKIDNDSLLDDDIGSVKIKKKNVHFNQIVTDKATNTAKLTLNDCLACSGCITSAETVLIKQQSTSQMESYLTTHKNAILIVTVSNQALIAIANRYKMDTKLAMHKISAFFKQEYNAKYVFNTNIALEIVLKESIHEFITNYTQNFIAPLNEQKTEEKKQQTKQLKLPILSSECPGFVCYAEKSCKASVLHYISSLKSPQQIMGLLIKKYLLNKINKQCNNSINESQIYHVTVMPCYDKKLEASRKEFILQNNTNIKEVDCVITSVEIEQLLNSKEIHNLSTFNSNNGYQRRCDDILQWFESGNTFVSEIVADNKGSHGYLENIFIASAKQLFGIDFKLNDLKYKRLRNEDIEELSLVLNEEEISNLPFKFRHNSGGSRKVLSFLRCYGFRNIQNVIRKIEKHKSKYHYVEIMACPFGCLNGGGQIRMDLNDIESKKITKQRLHIEKMRELLYKSQVTDLKQIDKNRNVKISDVLYRQVLQCDVGSNDLLKMTLKHVDNTAKLNINW